MLREIQFDGSGLAYSCPKADIGCVSFDECRDCPSHKGFKGFCADCSYNEPDVPENFESLSRKVKMWRGICR